MGKVPEKRNRAACASVENATRRVRHVDLREVKAMIKAQKTFSALECGICKYAEKCCYGKNYKALYKAGVSIPINACMRIKQQQKR